MTPCCHSLHHLSNRVGLQSPPGWCRLWRMTSTDTSRAPRSHQRIPGAGRTQVSTRVSDAELRQIEDAAAPLSVSAWLRGLILDALQ